MYANDEARRHYRRVLASEGVAAKGSETARLEALVGLGQVYINLSQYAEAEPRFREAIALGHKTGMAADDLARLVRVPAVDQFHDRQSAGMAGIRTRLAVCR